jgi:hypothetical protein
MADVRYFITQIALLVFLSANAQIQSKRIDINVTNVFVIGDTITVVSRTLDSLRTIKYSVNEPDNVESKIHLIRDARDFFVFDNALWFTARVEAITKLYKLGEEPQLIHDFEDWVSPERVKITESNIYFSVPRENGIRQLSVLSKGSNTLLELHEGLVFSSYLFDQNSDEFLCTTTDGITRIYAVGSDNINELMILDSFILGNAKPIGTENNTLIISGKSFSKSDRGVGFILEIDLVNFTIDTVLREPNLSARTLFIDDNYIYFDLYSGLFKVNRNNKGSAQRCDLVSEDKRTPSYHTYKYRNTLFHSISATFGPEYSVFANGELNNLDVNNGYVGSQSPNQFHYDNEFSYVFNATNGNDSFYYWYIVDKKTLETKPLAKWQTTSYYNSNGRNRYNQSKGFLTMDYFYWYDDITKEIKWLRLDGATESQPTVREPLTDEWEIQLFRPISTYSAQSSGNLHLADIAADMSDNLYVSTWRQSPWNQQTTTSNYSDSLYQSISTHQLIKINNKGQIEWNFNYGTTGVEYSGENNPIATDGESNIIIAGDLFNRSMLGTDTLEISRGMMFVAKLNPNGELLWYKLLNPSYWANRFTNIAIDRGDNIYLSFEYDDFNFQGITSSLSSNADPTNGLMKLDKEGNEVWLINIPLERLNSVQNITDIRLDRNTKSLYVLATQSGYNYWSSCKYNEDYNTVFKFDLAGNLTWSKEFSSDDVLYGASLSETKFGDLEVNGFVRGSLNADSYFYNTAQIEGCQELEPYALWLDPKNGNVTSLRTGFMTMPFSAAQNNAVTVFAGSENGELVVRSHLQDEPIVRIDKSGDPFDFGYNTKMSFGRESLYIADISNGPTASNANPYYVSQSIFIKRKLINELDVYPRYVENNPVASVYLFPNPAISGFRYDISDESEFNKIEIIDLKGSIILNKELIGKTGYVTLSDEVVNGFYIVRFMGQNNFETIKLIVDR